MSYDVIFDNVGSTAYPPQLSATYDVTRMAASATRRVSSKLRSWRNGGIFPGSLPGGSNLSVTDARQSTSSYLPDQVLPYSIQWNFGVQHVFHNDYTFEARYLGTRGVHLLTQIQLNKQNKVDATHLPADLPLGSVAGRRLNGLTTTLHQHPGALRRSCPPMPTPASTARNITAFMPWGDSIYHGLATQLTRRFAHGFQMHGCLHLEPQHRQLHGDSLLHDPLAAPSAGLPEPERRAWQLPAGSPSPPDGELAVGYAVSSRNSNSWAMKNLIGNWRFVGTYTAESGEWVTAQSGTDSNLNGDTAPDRTIVNPSGDAKLGSDVTPLKNSAGATVAYLATNPNARYITAGTGALGQRRPQHDPDAGHQQFRPFSRQEVQLRREEDTSNSARDFIQCFQPRAVHGGFDQLGEADQPDHDPTSSCSRVNATFQQWSRTSPATRARSSWLPRSCSKRQPSGSTRHPTSRKGGGVFLFSRGILYKEQYRPGDVASGSHSADCVGGVRLWRRWRRRRYRLRAAWWTRTERRWPARAWNCGPGGFVHRVRDPAGNFRAEFFRGGGVRGPRRAPPGSSSTRDAINSSRRAPSNSRSG